MWVSQRLSYVNSANVCHWMYTRRLIIAELQRFTGANRLVFQAHSLPGLKYWTTPPKFKPLTWTNVIDCVDKVKDAPFKWHLKMTMLKAKATDDDAEGDRRRREDDGWRTAMIIMRIVCRYNVFARGFWRCGWYVWMRGESLCADNPI